jgi:hypothetical protein
MTRYVQLSIMGLMRSGALCGALRRDVHQLQVFWRTVMLDSCA